jgi:hypothetical protein
MLHWAWGIAKRHATRALMYGGLALMSGAVAHTMLMKRSVDPHAVTPHVTWLAISVFLTDLLCTLVGMTMVFTSLWRLGRGKH